MKPPDLGSRPSLDGAPGRGNFAEEPFPCPACGQMLGPEVRVCVACKQTIDRTQVRWTVSQPTPPQLARPSLATVGFPWKLFLILFLLRVVAGILAQGRWGLIRAEALLGTVELLCAAWVFYDAGRLGVSKPLRWALGSLFLWPIVFPWYLAGRRTPRASCPFVEGVGLPATVLLLVAIGLMSLLLRGPA